MRLKTSQAIPISMMTPTQLKVHLDSIENGRA
jgi:hypothetical protein